METIWERPERARPATVPLSRESIVRAAIELADADGLAAVSVRKVAAALGAGPMRLYGHLATKEELLDLMLDEVHGEIPLGPGPDWRATLEIISRGTRAAALRHPWFADLLGSRPHLGPYALARLEATLAALAAGLPDVDAVARAAETVGSYVTGAIRREIGHDDARWRAESGPYLTRMFATGRYPQLTRFVTESTHIDPEASFDAGLRLILDGLGAERR